MIKKLILYGSGMVGLQWMERLGSDKVYAFADSDDLKIGKKIGDKNIISIEEILNIKEDVMIFISTSHVYRKEIYQLLVSKHLGEQVVGYPELEEKIYVDKSSYIDINTIFEGRNALLPNVQLHNCLVGFASYISGNAVFQNIKIGRYTTIGPNVRIIVGQHPTRNFVSIHPVFYSTQQTIRKSYVSKNLFDEYRYTDSGWTVEIGNDVWIGDGSTIMEGVTIADGTIVAAGANVVRDTEPYTIIGGNPARVIRYRFEMDDINFLLQLRWWDRGEDWIDRYAKYFDDIKKLRKAQDII